MRQGRDRTGKIIRGIYDTAHQALGPRHWWPADSDEEVVIGAVLTQNTAWKNVEKALGNLREKGVLSIEAIDRHDVEDLARLIRPAGYFNLKARRLKAVAHYFMRRCEGRLESLRQDDPAELRKQLLDVYGVGPETADSILLYALHMPVFVVDAYTRRILSRHGLCSPSVTYDELQQLLTSHLPRDVALFNEYHALLVAIGNGFCRPTPLCEQCPLNCDKLFSSGR